MLQQLSYQQDDIENRNHRNNIRVRGIPETVDPKNLPVAVTAYFINCWNAPKMPPLNWLVCIGPQVPGPWIPSLCEIPCAGSTFTKSRRTSWEQHTILFNDTPVMLLPDLLRQTLVMKNALKTLTQLLQSKQIKYQWRFPLHLQVNHEGKTAIFCTLGDLPSFLSTLELPQVLLPDWQFTPTTPGLSFALQWQKQGRKCISRTLSQQGPNDWILLGWTYCFLPLYWDFPCDDTRKMQAQIPLQPASPACH